MAKPHCQTWHMQANRQRDKAWAVALWRSHSEEGRPRQAAPAPREKEPSPPGAGELAER